MLWKFEEYQEVVEASRRRTTAQTHLKRFAHSARRALVAAEKLYAKMQSGEVCFDRMKAASKQLLEDFAAGSLRKRQRLADAEYGHSQASRFAGVASHLVK